MEIRQPNEKMMQSILFTEIWIILVCVCENASWSCTSRYWVIHFTCRANCPRFYLNLFYKVAVLIQWKEIYLRIMKLNIKWIIKYPSIKKPNKIVNGACQAQTEKIGSLCKASYIDTFAEAYMQIISVIIVIVLCIYQR